MSIQEKTERKSPYHSPLFQEGRMSEPDTHVGHVGLVDHVAFDPGYVESRSQPVFLDLHFEPGLEDGVAGQFAHVCVVGEGENSHLVA